MKIQPGTDIGRYHILEQLGEGGMALVYKAYDTRLESEVAVKVIRVGSLPPDALPRIQKRFQLEAKKMAQLNHPNIVKVMDYGEFDGAPFLVMPYLPGGTLKDKLGNPMDWQEAIHLLLPIAEALNYAHSEGLIHRDIKPSNILITKSGQPMLSDFGVAKVLESEETLDLTGTGMGVGTPEYMAPEMGMQKNFDHRADVYSLGIVLYELMTGRKPFRADTPMAVLFKHATDPLPRPSEFNPDIPKEIEGALYKALAKDPRERYESMDSFARALEKVKPIKVIGEKIEGSGQRAIPVQPPYKPNVTNKGLDKRWLYGLLGLAGLILVSSWITDLLQIKKEKANSERASWAEAVSPTIAPEGTPTLEPVGSSAPIIKTSDIDGMQMVYIPAGEFLMGSENGEDDERPVHLVYLDAYYIDQTEVTNAQYRLCVEDGVCEYSTEFEILLADNNYADRPVISVSWNDATTYCNWASRQLPTEAQWEKAARGTDERTYPWGEKIDCNRAYYSDCIESNGPNPVGNFGRIGASPYGVFDMAGNVYEWVADWYDANYYSRSTDNNPIGPTAGKSRAMRGGSWAYEAWSQRSASRGSMDPNVVSIDIGFRCAMDAD